MPLPTIDEKNYFADLESGRRVELRLSTDCLLTLQYFPEFDNISLSFYTKDMPGFTIGVKTEDWPRVQEVVGNFNWKKLGH